MGRGILHVGEILGESRMRRKVHVRFGGGPTERLALQVRNTWGSTRLRG